jgi:hypothetical protein
MMLADRVSYLFEFKWPHRRTDIPRPALCSRARFIVKAFVREMRCEDLNNAN